MTKLLRRRLLILISLVICFEAFILVVTTVKVTPLYSSGTGIRGSNEAPQTLTNFETIRGSNEAPQTLTNFETKLNTIRDQLMAKAIAGIDIRNRNAVTNYHNNRTIANPPPNQPLDFRPPILMDPEIKKKGDVVILVPSHQESFLKRQAIRETWKAAAENSNATSTILFVIGQSDCLSFDADLETNGNNRNETDEPLTTKTKERSCEEIEHEFLKLEQDQYQDLLEIPIVEAYNLLSEKMVQAYHWVLTNFKKTKWVTKADDDMFVNVRNLEQYLVKYNPEIPMVIGEIIHNSTVAREGKWADFEYNHTYYPDWPKGSAGHVLSRRVVDYIVNHSEELYRYQGEDTNIGIWMDEAGPKQEKVTYVNARHLFGSSGKSMCLLSPFNYLILGHDLGPSDLKDCQAKSDQQSVAEIAWYDRPRIFKEID